MKPLSNKLNVMLLIIAIVLLAYFLIDFATILSGAAIISCPIYTLYITIGTVVLVIVSLAVLILLNIRWGSSNVNARRFEV